MNALTWPSIFFTRSMQACVRSRADIFLVRTRRAASAIVNSFSMLFDDFGNQEEAVGFSGCVSQGVFVGKRRPRLVRARGGRAGNRRATPPRRRRAKRARR